MIHKLKSKRKGQAGFEWFILSPLFLAMLLAAFILWVSNVNNVTMNNNANQLAQNLNLRQVGLMAHMGSATSGTFVTPSGRTVVIHAGHGINKDYMAAATNYIKEAINEGRFDLPISRTNPINVTVSADGETDTIIYGTAQSLKPGSKIFVEIEYMNFGILNRVTGRSIII